MAAALRIKEPTLIQDVCFRVLQKQQSVELPHNFMPYYLATKDLLEEECEDPETLMKIAMDAYIDIASAEGFKIEVSHLKQRF